MCIMSWTFHCFRKETGHISTEKNVYPARIDLQMRALSEQKVDGRFADLLGIDADTPDYASIGDRIIQNNYVNDAISTYM